MRCVLRIPGSAALLGPMVLLGACAGPTGSSADVGSASLGSTEVEAPAAVTPAPSGAPDPSAEAESSLDPEPAAEDDSPATSSPPKAAAWAARGMKSVGLPAALEDAWMYWYDSNGPFLHAVSADEVWVTGESSLYRYRDGRWHDAEAASDCLTPATDGALWTTAGEASVEYPGGGRLFRSTAAGSGVVTDRPALCGYGAGTFAGPQGSVWVIQDDEVVRVRPDGRRTSIGRPARVDPDLDPDYGDSDRVCLHGVDPAGAVWVTEISDEDDEECTAGTWHRWNGQRWQTAAEPDPFTSAREQVVSGPGIGWTITSDAEGGSARITRYKSGRQRVIAKEPGLAALTTAPDGGACALAYPSGDSIDATAIVCFDAKGEIGRIDVAGLDIEGVSVAPDGAIWVAGPQVARIGRMSDLS